MSTVRYMQRTCVSPATIDEYSKERTTKDIENGDGRIIIHTEIIKQANTEIITSDWVQIKISDNGPGISAELQKKLFDPFFTTKPTGKGTGLGLSISYQILVEKHQGNIICCSEVGKGTTFMIQIPVQQKLG